jgi:hypothetical protein
MSMQWNIIWQEKNKTLMHATARMNFENIYMKCLQWANV